MKRLCFPTFLICLFAITTNAQLFIDNSYSIEEMVMDFFDNSCVTPTNITTTGAPESVAFFDAGDTNLGISAGIFISTGDVFSAIGPNNSSTTGQNMNINGDVDLDNILGSSTYDGITIEMDLTATDTLLEFSYVFASEEYPEFVGSFNDIFAFFVSGPGISGTENIALIPGTSLPVAINNVNSNTNANYYVDNTNGQDIEFDGFTTEMNARMVVVPNQTYHVKIVIADALDALFNSGIFLGIKSLCGEDMIPLVNNSNVDLSGNTITFENLTRYASSHFWDFGDGNTSSEKIPTPHTYAADGTYEVSLITSNFCCSDTTYTEVQIGNSTSVNQIKETPFSVVPNPIKEQTIIQLENQEAFQIKIYSSTGRLLFTEKGIGQTQLEMIHYPSGLYLLEIQIGKSSYREKLIKL